MRHKELFNELNLGWFDPTLTQDRLSVLETINDLSSIEDAEVLSAIWNMFISSDFRMPKRL